MAVIFLEDNTTSFPPPEMAEPDGLLAVGGNLSVESLLSAYSNGIFPWYNDWPVLWWSLDPRLILFHDNLRVTKSLQQSLRKNELSVKFDTCFHEVIVQCAMVNRKGQNGTWITPDMAEAFVNLHQAGYAHSVETFYKDKLVGGLYGVSLGGMFSGESMFHLKPDASKIALYHLVQKTREWNFDFIDAQQPTEHMKRMGAQEVPREIFLDMLAKTLQRQTKHGKWT